MQTKIFGHRGAKAYYPENTLLSFEKALEMGADGVELDVHFSRDGKIVVFHDFELARMTGAEGYIFEKTYEELKALKIIDSNYEESIPTLEMVLELLAKTQISQNRDIYLNVEFKAGSSLYKGIEKATADLCLKYLPKNQVIFSSFDHFALVAVKDYDETLLTGVLTTAAMVDPWEYVQKLKADFYHPYYLTLMPEVLDSYQQNDLRISPYTVNDLKIAKLLKEAGVYGIITDIPDQILKI